MLAVGNNQIYAYKVIIENTTLGVFIDFLKEVFNNIMKDRSNKYFIILDNLPAHKTQDVFKFLKDKQICTVFNAPYKSIFNAVELSFRAVKKITYSNIYNTMEEVEKDIINFLENENFKNTLLYCYG